MEAYYEHSGDNSTKVGLYLSNEDIEQLQEIAGRLVVDCLYKGKITTPKLLLHLLNEIISKAKKE